MDKIADINDRFEPNEGSAPEKLLLHACCGPCSLEPLRVLASRGIKTAIHFSNSNIAPIDEYERRLDAIREHARDVGVELIEDDYDNAKWTQTSGRIGAAAQGTDERRARCRACYRMRLERSASYAKEHGFDSLGTTLSVSPYQYGDIICEELKRACERHGIRAFYEDYSPLYAEATRRSRASGMYRQNYCGCLLSKDEADMERKERKAERDARKAKRKLERQQAEQDLEIRRKERREYDAKQAKKRAVLKALREQRKDGEADE